MERSYYLPQLEKALKTFPAVCLLGPRQSGKTTLAQQFAHCSNFEQVTHFDLEDPTDVERLKDPKLTLSGLTGLIIIDEVQHMPELFPVLRVLIDRYKDKQRYLLLGSASRKLLEQTAESLTGRIKEIEVSPFSYAEVQNSEKLWVRGGFPCSFLAESDEESMEWRSSYIRNFIEYDVPRMGYDIPSQTLYRLWMMLIHYHGQFLNFSEIAKSLSIASNTVRRYVDILLGTYMLRELQPWYENIGKRQVKTPKLYFRDSGIFHSLVSIENKHDLLLNAKIGASWEGFALESVIRGLGAYSNECYFWATHNRAELDLLINKGNKKQGFEFKYSSAPKLSKSMQIAQEDLGLDSLTVIVPGDAHYPLSQEVEVIGLEYFLQTQITRG